MKEKNNFTVITDESIITLVNWNKELFEKCIKYQEEIGRLNNIINEFDRYIDEIIDERIEKIEGTRFLKGGFTIEQNYLRRRLHERLQELKGSNNNE